MGYPAFETITLTDPNTVTLGGNDGPGDTLVKIEAVIISAENDQKRLESAQAGKVDSDGCLLPLGKDWTVAFHQSGLTDRFRINETVIVAGIGTTTDDRRVLWGGFTSQPGPPGTARTVVGSKKIT